MDIGLDSYEITKAIKMYLKARGVNWEDEYLEMNIQNEEQEIINLNAYKSDEHWDEESNKWITDAEYEVVDLFVKRRKKGQTKYEYVPFDYVYVRTYLYISEDSLARLEINEGE